MGVADPAHWIPGINRYTHPGAAAGRQGGWWATCVENATVQQIR